MKPNLVVLINLIWRAAQIAATAGIAGSMSAPAEAQTARTPIQLDPTSPGPATGHAAATGSDCSAVAWMDSSDNGIYIAVSNGTAIQWSAPIRVDASIAGKFLVDGDSVKVQGTRVFVLWEDFRFDNPLTSPFVESELVLAVYDRATQTLFPEVIVPKGTPPGTNSIATNATRYRFAVTQFAGNDVVWVAMSTDDPLTAVHDLVISVSHDGGTTFPVVQKLVTAASQIDVDDFDFDADGGTACAAWADNRNILGGSLDDTFASRTADGGATFTAPVQLDASGALNGDVDSAMSVAVRGSTCGVLWQEEQGAGGGTEVLHASVSTGGAFVVDSPVGFYTFGIHDVDGPILAITASGGLVASWNDDRTGADEVYVATSPSGIVWTETAKLSSTGGGLVNVVPFDDVNHDGVTISWQEGPFPNALVAAYSHDGGATFDFPIEISQSTGDVDGGYLAFNPFYRNYVLAWIEDPVSAVNHVFVGGFRPQTLTANGFLPGNTTVNFDFDRYEVAGCPLGFVFLSFSQASTVANGHDLLIGVDPLFLLSIDLAATGILSTPLVNGAGSTIQIPATLPGGGITLYAIGLGVNPGAGALCSLSDAVTITLP